VRRLVILLVPILLVACTDRGGGDTAAPSGTSSLAIGSGPTQVVLRVEVADTPEERSTGLMGREHLPEDLGMAFLFDGPTTARFWMKDTLIPLSIGFWDEGGSLVDILDMPPCAADPCPTYGPDVPYVGAVEVNEGWFQRSGVQVGDHVALEG
jgi:hypothetical protein